MPVVDDRHAIVEHVGIQFLREADSLVAHRREHFDVSPFEQADQPLAEQSRRLWMRRIDDHYEYIGVYVDDLCIAAKVPKTQGDWSHSPKLKETGPITFHLG